MIRKRRFWIAALVLGGLALASLWGLWALRPVLAPFLLAVVVAYLISPLVNAIVQAGLSRGWAILVVYMGLGAVGWIGVSRILPQALAEIQRLAESIPIYALRSRELIGGIQQDIREMGVPPSVQDVVNRTITEVEVGSVAALEALLSAEALSTAAGFLVSLAISPILAFYLLKDHDRFRERFVNFLPRPYRQEIVSLIRRLDRVVAGFVRGQIILAIAVGVLAGLVTHFLGLRFALLLGIWAGITELIPYVGPILGAIPAVLAGLTVSPLLALQTAIAFAIIQQIENAVLSPKIMGETLGLHPLAVMLSILAGGYLFGTWGLLLALPVVGLLKEVVGFTVSRLTEVPATVVVAPAPAMVDDDSYET